jgi:tetratricopeptide (TPR) repeat protein
MALAPSDPGGALVLGGCLEDAGRFEEAVALYDRYLQGQPSSPAAAAVEAQKVIATREWARAWAADLVRDVDSMEALPPPDPTSVGVFPFLVAGGEGYESLGVGLAHMLTTDLALLGRFNMVERVRMDALLQEQGLSRDLIDPTTAARTGRLLGASRLVLGGVSVFSERETQLSGNIVRETGELVVPVGTQGGINDILDLEKEFAIQTAEGLGYVLSEAERQRILANRPRNLNAFLLFSQGLMAEDLGDFAAASQFYQEALSADPNFGEARGRRDRAVGQQVLTERGPGGATAAEGEIGDNLRDMDPQDTPGDLSNTLVSAIIDIAPQQAEQSTGTAGTEDTKLDVQGPGVDPPGTLFEAILNITIVIRR